MGGEFFHIFLGDATTLAAGDDPGQVDAHFKGHALRHWCGAGPTIAGWSFLPPSWRAGSR